MRFERVATSLHDKQKYAIPDEGVGAQVASNIERGKTEFTTWTATLIGIVFALGGTFLLVEIQKNSHTRGTWLLWVGLVGLTLAVLSLGFGVASYYSQMRGLLLNPHHWYLFTEAREERQDVEHRMADGVRVTENIGIPYETWKDALEKHLKWVWRRDCLMRMQLITFSVAIAFVFIDVVGFVFQM